MALGSAGVPTRPAGYTGDGSRADSGMPPAASRQLHSSSCGTDVRASAGRPVYSTCCRRPRRAPGPTATRRRRSCTGPRSSSPPPSAPTPPAARTCTTRARGSTRCRAAPPCPRACLFTPRLASSTFIRGFQQGPYNSLGVSIRVQPGSVTYNSLGVFHEASMGLLAP
jgi:hypothetical protein